MKLVMAGLFAVGLAAWLALTAVTAQGQSPPGLKPFLVFDGTLYSDKPDLSGYGLRPITIAYAGSFGSDWYKHADRLPDLQAVQAVARGAQQKGHVVVLDIEHWPLGGSADLVHDSLEKYKTVLQWFHDAAPGFSVGYYGAPPIQDYWRATNEASSQEHRAWKSENDRVRSLASAVDVLFPSLYTFYPDQAGWKRYAIAQIEEARRYGNGKPVYVFLWPQYHDSNPLIGNRFLPEDYWLLELETAKQYADGIVIWGGWGRDSRPARWDENAAWWTVTKKFMKNREQSPPVAPTSLAIH